MIAVYVYVRVKRQEHEQHGNGWKMEWRTVAAESLQDGFKEAAKLPDVEHVYEVSLVPGGVVV